MKNALSIDVEDYFMVENFSSLIPFENWGEYPMRLARNVDTLLELFSARNVKATFFVLGWVGERLPQVVKSIAAAGHEVACHGYSHRPVYQLGKELFEEEIHKAKSILENLCRHKIVGYRAATYSINKTTPWAWDILLQAGFSYDSSYRPMLWRRLPGLPLNHPAKIAAAPGKKIMEFPISTKKFFGLRIPFCGGGYFRLFPRSVIASEIRRLNAKKVPANVFIHPWEIDPEQPRLAVNPLLRFRHYVGIAGTLKKMDALLGEFEFAPLREILGL